MKYLFIVLSLIITISVIVYGYLNFNSINQEKNKKIQFLQDRISIMKQFDQVRIKYEDSKINKLTNLVDFKNNITDLKILSNKLILFVPNGVCHLCYEGFYSDLQNMSKVCGKDNFAILVPQARLRELKGELGNINSKLLNIIFGVNLKTCGLELGNKHLIFLFYLDKNIDTHNLYIINKNIPETTKAYTEIIAKKYF